MNVSELIQGLDQKSIQAFSASSPEVEEGGYLWVESGAVDCFIRTASEYSTQGGPLVHLFRVERGCLCPTPKIRSSIDSGYLVWTVLPGSICWIVPSKTLHEHARNCDGMFALEFALAQWLDYSSVEHIDRPGPSIYLDISDLDTHHECQLEAGTMLSSSNEIDWICLHTGELEWLANPDASIRVESKENEKGGPVYLPIHRRHWMRAVENCVISHCELSYLAKESFLTNAIKNYFQILFDSRLSTLASERQKIANNYEEQKRRNEQLTKDAVSNLASVMQGDVISKLDFNNSFVGALSRLEQLQELDFRLDEQSVPLLGDAASMVNQICRFASVRNRRVALKGDWWKSDSGPLLMRGKDAKDWYSAIPIKGGGYRVYRGDSTESSVMRLEFAESFNGFAYSFYRSFPDLALRPVDLIKFGLHGLKNDLSILLSMAMLSGVIALAMPIAAGKIVESVIPSGEELTLLIFGSVLITAMLVSTVFDLTRSIAQLRMESRMDGSVQAAVWDRVLKLPVAFFSQYSAGDLSTRISAINTIRAALSGTAISTILSGVFSSFSLILLFYYNAKIAFIACMLVLGAVAIVLVVGIIKLRYERQIADAEGRLTSLVYEYLSGIPKLRAAASENRAFFNWSKRFSHIKRLDFRAQQLSNIDNTLFSGYRLLTTAVIFSAVGASLTSGDVDTMGIGEFIAFNAAFGTFFAAVVSVSDMALKLVSLIPVYERAKPIFEQELESHGNKSPLATVDGNIDIARLTFSYPGGPEVIRDLSLSIRAGEFVALVGTSGCGKSTLLRLLLGFERADKGTIHFDNQDMDQLDLNALRRHIGVVLQSGKVLSGDIFNNIVGPNSLSLDDAWEAAKMVGLDEDIKLMPMGMHTVISEGASTLSGGQRQRILIARAIVTRPRILFFDEATSALDNKTQAVVSRSLENLKATRVVIAHRLSTIINADRIIVMASGQIVQTGTYQDLIEQGGVFGELVKRQIT